MVLVQLVGIIYSIVFSFVITDLGSGTLVVSVI